MAFAKGVSFADAFEGEKDADEILLDYLMDLCVMSYDRMEELGINQQEFARLMGKKESQISRMLSGEKNITLKTLAQMDEALGLGIELRRGSRAFSTGATSSVSQNYVGWTSASVSNSRVKSKVVACHG